MKFVAKKLTSSLALALAQKEVKRGLGRLVAVRLPCHGYGRELMLGRVHAGPITLTCALGRAGIKHTKFEGDQATPAGRFRFLASFFRSDRIPRKAWPLPMRALVPSDGWCDDPQQAAYNRRVALPRQESHEKLWRFDNLYDLIIVLDYNIHPRCKNRGSAIFLHCARPDLAPTEGCVALRPDDLRRLLPRLAKNVVLTIR
ncbi:MAG TPA: L,D-transpeptidase family protein [Methylocella sp.]|nr:L,D-transpeptidase family protein [Methylocella sp.]